MNMNSDRYGAENQGAVLAELIGKLKNNPPAVVLLDEVISVLYLN